MKMTPKESMIAMYARRNSSKRMADENAKWIGNVEIREMTRGFYNCRECGAQNQPGTYVEGKLANIYGVSIYYHEIYLCADCLKELAEELKAEADKINI